MGPTGINKSTFIIMVTDDEPCVDRSSNPQNSDANGGSDTSDTSTDGVELLVMVDLE